MTPEPRTEIVEILEQSRKDFLDAIGSLPETLASTKPAEGRWSVAECVEHVVVAEQRFFGFFLVDPPRAAAAPVDKDKETRILGMVTDRQSRAQAPEPVQPTGRFSSLAQGLDEFSRTRARTIEFAQAHSDDLSCYPLEHRRFGPVNGCEMMIIIAGHARRHAEQIRETKAALGIA